MANQQYIEEIIKVAIEGDWIPSNAEVFKKCKNKKEIFETFHFCYPDGESIKQHRRYFQYFLDPNFFRAIGRVKWNDENKWRMIGGVAHKIDMKTGKYIPVWIYHALTFYEINFTQDLDHAIEWLYNLIKE